MIKRYYHFPQRGRVYTILRLKTGKDLHRVLSMHLGKSLPASNERSIDSPIHSMRHFSAKCYLICVSMLLKNIRHARLIGYA
jgi:hypothetical protein